MKHILYVLRIGFSKHDSGGAQRSWLIYRALADLAEVDTVLVSEAKRALPDELERMREHYNLKGALHPWPVIERGPWPWIGRHFKYRKQRLHDLFSRMSVHYAPDPHVGPAFDKIVADKPYDLIVGRYLSPSAAAGIFRYVPTIMDVDDLDGPTIRSQMNVPGMRRRDQFTLWNKAWRVERVTKKLLRRTEHVWVTKQEDVEALAPLPTTILPNLPFIPATTKGFQPPTHNDDSKVIMFIGRLSWSRNKEGVDWFVEHCWPQIHKQVPSAEFHIVGSELLDAYREKWGMPGVKCVGFVDDVVDAYRDAAFSIVPIFAGGGSNIKTAESLAYGRTAVLTPHALRGYDHVLKHDESVLVGNDIEEIVRHCVTLLNNPQLRNKFADVGGDAIRMNYSFDAFRRTVHQTASTAVEDCNGVKLTSK